MSGPEWFCYEDEWFEGLNDAVTALDNAEDAIANVTEDWWKADQAIEDLDVEDIRAGIVLWRPVIVDIPEEERDPGNEAEDEPAGPTQRWQMELDAEAVAAVLQYATLDQLKTEMERRIKDIDVQLRAVGEE